MELKCIVFYIFVLVVNVIERTNGLQLLKDQGKGLPTRKGINALYSLDCNLAIPALITERPNYSQAYTIFSSNKHVNVPCNSRRFYMTFNLINNYEDDYFYITISTSERTNSVANALISFPLTEDTDQSYISVIATQSYMNSTGHYIADVIGNPVGASEPLFVFYNGTGLYGGVRGKILVSFKSKPILEELFGGENVYVRAGTAIDRSLMMAKIKILCSDDDTCSLPQKPSTILLPENSNKNKNLICSNSKDNVVKSNKLPDIHIKTAFNGNPIKLQSAANVVKVSSETGIIELSFQVSVQSRFYIMVSNQNFYGTTFEQIEFDLEIGEWTIGNVIHANPIKAIANPRNSTFFIKIEPEGISAGFNDKTVGILGYKNFDMDDLISKDYINFAFLSYTKNTVFSKITSSVLSRTCNPGANLK
ncbi:hypothetical protein BB561_005973 [Smittium simulii]|uniref:Uncharacterized protein n=1 Tax=Smittium simulii TaxID=133385 RepID=A0A2T9Y795_9FUNG|nr:hypothetical protein BB561_005973 [Smittium simulii]